MDHVQADVEVAGCLDAPMAQQLPDDLVFSLVLFEEDCSGGVPELVHGNAQSSDFFDPPFDLQTEDLGTFGVSSRTGKQPRLVRAPQQFWAVVMDVLVDDLAHRGRQLELKLNAVFYIIMWKDQPILPLQASRLDQVLIKSDAANVANPTGCESENRDGDRQLSGHRCLNFCLMPIEASLGHKGPGQPHHFIPNTVGQNRPNDF